MKSDLILVVNNSKFEIRVDARTPLLYVLRDHLGLSGVRFGCGMERCGSCMVMIDGVPEYSCSREVGTVVGRSITTVEGLPTNGELHLLQQAFIDEQAGQCGYCLPGILMSSAALLERNPFPTRDDIARALDPHLCRCGAHNHIVRAVQRAAKAMRTPS